MSALASQLPVACTCPTGVVRYGAATTAPFGAAMGGVRPEAAGRCFTNWFGHPSLAPDAGLRAIAPRRAERASLAKYESNTQTHQVRDLDGLRDRRWTGVPTGGRSR
jgi:hypothetical protein